jgi:hypothetical protein
MHASRGHSAPTTTRLYPPLPVNATARGAPAIHRRMRDRCWASELTAAASLARTTALHVATGASPRIGAPGTTWSRAARRLVAARSLPVTQAEPTMTAPPPVRTALVPRASLTTPTPGWTTSRVCGGPSRTAG